PKALYEVRFRQKDLWPDYSGSDADTLDIDIYEHWLAKI
ncbi:MAG: nitrile hydratase subunit beta, partial [Alphaproteobacteria bacterium]|nr:nitrile hydratase subunit beta [Alphaproteobacteria bacterium]